MVSQESQARGDQLFKELVQSWKAAHPGSGGDDDGGSDEKDSEATPSYQPRKRQYHRLPAVKTYNTHISFFLLLLQFFISFSRHLNSV